MEKEEKIRKFKQAISQICIDGKARKRYFIYNFCDSFHIAKGDIGDYDFVKSDLVRLFKDTIEKFRKDLKDNSSFRMALLDVSTELNFGALSHAIG